MIMPDGLGKLFGTLLISVLTQRNGFLVSPSKSNNNPW